MFCNEHRLPELHDCKGDQAKPPDEHVRREQIQQSPANPQNKTRQGETPASERVDIKHLVDGMKEVVDEYKKGPAEILNDVADLADQVDDMKKGVDRITSKISEMNTAQMARRRATLEQVFKKYSEIALQKLAVLLDFEDTWELERWILERSGDLPLQIEGNVVKITGTDLTADIDRLIAAFDEWKNDKRGKKA